MIISFEDRKPLVKGVVAESARVIGDVEIGLNSSVWSYSVLRGDYGKIRVGEYCNIQEFCMLHADADFPCLVGDKVTVAHGVLLHSCRINEYVFIGAGARIMENVEIGENSLIGAGSLVLPGVKVPRNSVVAGVPAKILRKTTKNDIGYIENGWRLYYENSKKYQFEYL